MDKKTKGKIINAVRRLTYAYEPRNKAKNKQKVAPATFECENCGIWVYEGSKTLEKLSLDAPKGLVKGKVCMDHIEPIIPPEGFKSVSWCWNEYLERMFCEQEGFQCICKGCHDIKTQFENQLRKDYRQSKKKLDK